MSVRFAKAGEERCDSHFKGIRCLCRRGHTGYHQDARYNWPNSADLVAEEKEAEQ